MSEGIGRMRSSLLALVLTPVFFALAAAGVVADTLVVDRTDDDAAAGACTGAPGDCSLRGAVITANGNGVGDTIVFEVDGAFVLSIPGADEDVAASGDLDILDDLTISGNGITATAIDGGALDRVFDVHPGMGGVIAVAFENLTIRNGRTPASGMSFLNSGAAIDFPAGHGGSGTLAIRGCRLTQNATGNSSGGAIYVSGAFGQPVPVLQIIDSEIMSNTAHLGGGGVRCDNCDLSVSGSDVSLNDALVTGGIGYGGGGLVVTGADAKADIRNSAFRENTSADDGGGILFASGVMTVSQSLLFGNIAGANGGGLSDEASLSGGSLQVTGSSFANNRATGGSGGGIYNDDLNLSVRLSRITGNLAGGTGAGIANTDGMVDAEDNWWGCDGFPGDAGCDSTSGAVDADPRIDLALRATPATVLVTQAASLVADVTRNTDGAAITPWVLDGLVISFAGNAFGDVAPTMAVLSDGQAGTTYTGESPGTADVSVSLDYGTETTPITVVAAIDLQVTKSESIDPVIVGAIPVELTYVVTVKNAGPSGATGVALNEALTLPPGVTVQSITPSAGAYVHPTWTIGALAAGTSETLTVVLAVSDAVGEGVDVIGDIASISHANELDVDLTNDTATEHTSVARRVRLDDLQVSLVGGPDPFCPGTRVSYTLQITNDSPIVLADMVMHDQAPPGTCCPLDGPESTVPGEISDPDTMVWMVDSLGLGESVRIDVTLHTFPTLQTGALISNTFVVSSTGLSEVGSAAMRLVADVGVCAPTPTPIAQAGRVWLPLIYRQGSR